MSEKDEEKKASEGEEETPEGETVSWLIPLGRAGAPKTFTTSNSGVIPIDFVAIPTATLPQLLSPYPIIEPDESKELALVKRRESAKSFILELHRAPDGYASFSFEDPITGEWKESCSIQVSHLQPLFPEFLDDLLDKPGAKVSIHSMYCPSYYPSGYKLSEKALKALPAWYGRRYKGFIAGALRKTEYVTYLNCCWTDLDIYKKCIPPAVALGAIKHLQDTGQIPKASMVVFTGHGVWVFWLLVGSKNPYSPPRRKRGGPESWALTSIYRQVQGEIARRLEPLGADPSQVGNLTLSARIPGSRHEKTGKEAEFWIPLTGGRGHVYTIEEMQAFFGITPREIAPKERKLLEPKPKGESKGRRAWGGFRQVYESHLRQFHALWDLRGKFPLHTRNSAAHLYAHLLNRNGFTRAEVFERISKFGLEGCAQPLSLKEINYAVGQAFKLIRDKDKGTGGFRNKTISEKLLITESEALMLETWKAYNAPPPEPKTHPHGVQSEIIRTEISKILDEAKRANARKPTCRQIADLLRERQIANLHYTTINRHMSLMKYGSPSIRAYRKKRQQQLFVDKSSPEKS